MSSSETHRSRERVICINAKLTSGCETARTTLQLLHFSHNANSGEITCRSRIRQKNKSVVYSQKACQKCVDNYTRIALMYVVLEDHPILILSLQMWESYVRLLHLAFGVGGSLVGHGTVVFASFTTATTLHTKPHQRGIILTLVFL